MDAPFISVVIPTYNASKFLREALDSLLAQSFTDWEAICVNDGSTDDSLSILQEYAAKDSRFRVLDGPNGGYGKAMNRGLDAARGVYTSILEPDDFTPRYSYEALATAAKQYHADVVRGEACYFYENADGARTYYSRKQNPSYHRIFSPRDKAAYFLCTPHTWCSLYHLDFLRKHSIRYNETPGAAYQDTGMFFLSAAYSERFVCIPDITYVYRTDNPNSSMHKCTRKGNVLMEEFAFIRSKLQERGMWTDVLQPFFLKRYLASNLWLLEKLEEDLKPAFLERFTREIQEMSSVANSPLLSPVEQNEIEILRRGAEAYSDTLNQRKRCGALEIQRYGVTYRHEYESNCKTFLLWGIPICRYHLKPRISCLIVFGIPLMKRITSPIYTQYGEDFRYISANRRTFYLLGIPIFSKSTPTIEFNF